MAAIYDNLTTFSDGLNSELSPLLIPKTTLANARNATVRGGFIRNRTAFTDVLDFVYSDDAMLLAVTTGRFQGACYYQPDSGPQCLIAQISGRIYQFSVQADTLTVTDITVPGDPNSDSTTQAWLWQCENYVIINDGIHLPAFYDGVTTRRSFGPAVLLGTATAATPTSPPSIGGQIAVTLSTTWAGVYDVPVLFNGEYYQPRVQATGYPSNITSLYSVNGEAIAIGAQVTIQPSVLGVLGANFTPSFPGGNFTADVTTAVLTLTQAYNGPADSSVKILFYDKVWRITQKDATLKTITIAAMQNGVGLATIPIGTRLQITPSSLPNVIVGNVLTPASAPSTGDTIQITLDVPFTGTPGQVVYLGTGQYTITAVPPPAPGTTLILENLTDNSIAPYQLPARGKIYSVPELPIGRMGAYGLTQNAMCLADGLTWIASDISRGPSGTPANQWRDAVLKTVDTTFRGGTFAISGAGNFITSMVFPAVIDTSFGQGNLQIGTPAGFFSCLWPFDFLNPPPLGTPILTESLKGTGSLGQNNTVLVNSDTLFRSLPGIGSLRLARREFNGDYGNTPISEEVSTFLRGDNVELLSYGTATVTDNRFLMSTGPVSSANGIYHTGFIAMNLDPVSSLRGKAPPVYDGLWDGINVMQFVTGTFTSKQRCFAFVHDAESSTNGIVELLDSNSPITKDNGDERIEWEFESAAIFNSDVKPSKQRARLKQGEFAIDGATPGQRLDFSIYYKADQGEWILWHSFYLTPDPGDEDAYYPRLGLPLLNPTDCTPNSQRPNNEGFSFQVKFVITGKCRFLRADFMAEIVDQPPFQAPICNAS